MEQQERAEPAESRPLVAKDGAFRFPSPDDSAFELVVPEKVLSDFADFKRRISARMEGVNRSNAQEQSLCVYCWMGATTNDTEQLIQLTELVSFSEIYSMMYPGTQKRQGVCRQCGGRFPMGREGCGVERYCKHSCLF